MTSEGIGAVPNFVEVFQVGLMSTSRDLRSFGSGFGADFQKAPNHARENLQELQDQPAIH
jgi:hypothetical protein